MYSLKLSKDAKKEVASLDAESTAEVEVLLRAIEADPAASVRSQAMGVSQALTRGGWRVFYRFKPRSKTILVEAVGKEPRFVDLDGTLGDAWPTFAREEAMRIVEEGIGKRPDLPSGKEYVDSVRHYWKGLLPHE